MQENYEITLNELNKQIDDITNKIGDLNRKRSVLMHARYFMIYYKLKNDEVKNDEVNPLQYK